MTKRKFYKTTFTVILLSEEPLILDNERGPLYSIPYLLQEGYCFGGITNEKHATLNGKQTAKALLKQREDPEYLQIDKNGNDKKE
jgi:hypothetical protein